MEPANRRILLHYYPEESTFTVSAVAENWCLSFDNLKDALNEATSRVVEQTPFVVYAVSGQEMLQTWVSPEGFGAEICWS